MASNKDRGGDDDRFLRVKKDPRFWEMPDKERKVKIDKRFQAMFHDERFKMKYTVDKRGRAVDHTTGEDLKRFYNVADSDQSEEEEEQEEEEKKKKKKAKSKVDGEKGLQREDVGEEAAEKGEMAVKSRDATTKPKGEPAARGVRVYEEGDEEEEQEEDLSAEEDEKDVDMRESLSEGSEEEDDSEEEEEDDDDEGESDSQAEESDSDSGPDLARGKGNVETSSDEDDDGDDALQDFLRREEEEIEHDWGEMWKDAPRNDDTTPRLAVCNMDWDRMKAKDLLALFSSFKPKDGVVLSVKIYPSEFGKERMQAEQTQGPLELTTLPDDPEADTEEQRIYREKVRDYQFKRLRYYYAVVECDSAETAAKIYEECDGHEYESSCSILDLRFIPSYVTFDEEPKDVATDVDYASYKPKLFTSAATTTAKVELTWDETDHDRVTALSRKFNKDELLENDFKAYLASSSEEEEEEEEVVEEEPEVKKAAEAEDEKRPKTKAKKDAEQIAKYKEILKGIQDKDRKEKDKAMEMEITWVPGLKETTEKLVKKKLEGKDKLTPWEEFLQKKKDKRKEKRKVKQESAEADSSDDELPSDVDLSDPFFAEELGSTGTALKNKSKSKKSKKVEEEKTPEEEEALEKQKAEMALLMDDDDGDKHKHFNFDKIVEHQNLSKKKRKKMLKSNTPVEEDDFQVDVKDPRFQAMFTSHLYNLDPSEPGYKKTKATQSILEEKQRRREERQRSQEAALTSRHRQEVPDRGQEAAPEVGGARGGAEPSQKAADSSLSLLIKSVKSKTEQFQARKKQKTK